MPTHFLFLILSFVALAASQATNPLVRIGSGALSGSWKISENGRTYASFQGIPYARPPVGKYRFRVRSENCLYVNVYSPKPNAGANLPVVVFIHGGAYMYGGSSVYDPKHLMDWDMVVVTVNYRLGPLGFLSTGDEVIPGNAGLKDQSFALKWIQNNIMMFGGNPDSVTLTGCSAGGASVHYHYLSQMSKGTFARGIAFSGSAFASWTHNTKPAPKAKSLASLVGCPTTNSRELADCLRYRPAEALVQAQIDMFEWRVHMFTPFVPTIEASNAREPFLTQYPYHAAQAGQMHKLPLITSVTSEEGLYPAATYQLESDILPELEARWGELASFIFEYNNTLPLTQQAAVAAKIKQRYLGGKPVSQQTFAQLVQALGDRLFVVDVGKLAQTHAVRSGQPVYVYRYSFRGEKSLSNMMAGNNENYGVSHADDIFHLFAYPGLESQSPADKLMARTLIDMVYSFATNGVPKVGNVQWTPLNPGTPELNYLEISGPTQAEMKRSSDFGQKSFWDSLGFREYENYNPFVKDEL